MNEYEIELIGTQHLNPKINYTIFQGKIYSESDEVVTALAFIKLKPKRKEQ